MNRYVWLFGMLTTPFYICYPLELKSRNRETCTRSNLQNCTQMKILRQMMSSYGQEQYTIKRWNTWDVMDNNITRNGNKTGPVLKYYMCDGNNCKFYNTNNLRMGSRRNNKANDSENDRTGGVRIKRNIVESCCNVNTTVVEVINVVNINDTNDVWNTTVGYENPTFVTRECTAPNSTCADEDGICTTVRDIHSVFAYQVDNSSNVEFRFLPVTFNVGCECRAIP